MSRSPLSSLELARALDVRDLTDPAEGRHAIQDLVDAAVGALARRWRIDTTVSRAPRVVALHDNYDALGYSADAVTRDQRYTRYVSDTTVLRSHMSAAVPGALRALPAEVDDALLACPGVVYRRDSIDRLHSATPHQLDLWRVSRRDPLGIDDLQAMIAVVVAALLPGADHRVEARVHPYTEHGLQIDIDNGGDRVEIGECGLAAPHVLRAAGISGAGLAMGLGLDRILMLRKGIADIRLLRSADPRVAAQMGDLSLYRSVSNFPAVVRDLSIAVADDDDGELLGDRVRDALGAEADAVETVEIVSQTARGALTAAARARLGIGPGQQNVLVRVVLRHPSRSLTRAEANRVRDRVYDALHCGSDAPPAGARASAS